MRCRQWLRGILIVFILFWGSEALGKSDDSLYEKLKLFADTLEIIQRDYVEEVDSQDLIYGALKGMLGSLDPNSQFMSPDLHRELQIQSQGHFGGLGMLVAVKDGFLTVVSPLEDTPASRAGMKSGDIIVEIEGESTKEMSLMEAVKQLRGPEGTAVTITVMRDREVLPELSLTRERIELPAVKEAEMVEEKIGYIRLVEFREGSGKEMEEALTKLEEEGMEGLILDLRGNPGGLLEAAVEVADKFLPKGKMIVYTQGKAAADRQDFLAREKPHPNYPLVVLVNGYSASASEIVAGAIQDWQRGLLIGTKTFGKASVQTVIPLRDGSALRLTTAKYFTPLGRSIHEKKIVPDIVVEEEKGGEEKRMSRHIYPMDNEAGKTEDGNSEEGDSKEKEISDPQLNQAIKILKAWPTFKAICKYEERKNEK